MQAKRRLKDLRAYIEALREIGEHPTHRKTSGSSTGNRGDLPQML
jgi:hypothetical protein